MSLLPPGQRPESPSCPQGPGDLALAHLFYTCFWIWIILNSLTSACPSREKARLVVNFVIVERPLKLRRHSTVRNGHLAVPLGSISCQPKKSYPGFCSQDVDPWDDWWILLSFDWDTLFAPLYVMLFPWRVKSTYCASHILVSPCTCVSLLQSGAVCLRRNTALFSEITNPTRLSLPSSLVGTKWNHCRIWFKKQTNTGLEVKSHGL